MYEFSGWLIENKKMKNGNFCYSSEEKTLYFKKIGLIAMTIGSSGALGSLIGQGMAAGKRNIQKFTIESIESVEFFKYRLNKKAIRIKTANIIIELISIEPDKTLKYFSELKG